MKFKHIGSEVSIWFKQVFRMKNGWLLLPGILAVVMVYAVHHFNIYPWLATKTFHENCAPWLVLAVFVILLTKSLISRDPLMIFLTVLALIFLTRELDATVFSVFGEEYLFKSKDLVKLPLVIMVLWSIWWEEKLFACLNRSILMKVSLTGVLWSYVFSQIIARRALRDILPDERLLHIPLEEAAETAAHVFFLVCSLCILFCYLPRKADQVQTFSSSAEQVDTTRELEAAVE